MNNQKGLASIIIVLIIIAFLVGGIFAWKYFSAPKEEVKVPEEAEEERLPPLSNTAECSKSSGPIEQIITGSFRSVDEFTSAGEVTLSGYVVTRDRKYFEEEVEEVYLEIDPQNENTPQANFYSYFIRMVERGNTVNLKEDNNLLFGLGKLTDTGNVFSSTADIFPLAEVKILSATKTGEIISHTVNFSANAALTLGGSIATDVTVPDPPTSIGTKVQVGTAVASPIYSDITDSRGWTLTITADNQAYVSSETAGSTRRIAGNISATISVPVYEDDFADLPVVNSHSYIRLYVTAATYWDIGFVRWGEASDLLVDREGATILGATLNGQWSGFADIVTTSTKGYIKKPDVSTWWGS